MMVHILKRALPFILGLAIGVAFAQLINGRKVRGFRIAKASPCSTRLQVHSVPAIEFPDAAKDFGEFQVTTKLLALFDANGQITEIRRPYELPARVSDYEVDNATGSARVTARGKRQFADLAYQLHEKATEHVKLMKFTPQRSNRHFVSNWVTVETSFHFIDWRLKQECSSIDVKITGDRGILWQGNAWEGNQECPKN